MRKLLRLAFGLAVLACCVPVLGQSPSTTKKMPPGAGPGQPEKKFEDFDKVVKGAKEYEGLFRLHHKDEHLYAEIRPDQLGHFALIPTRVRGTPGVCLRAGGRVGG